MIKEGDQVCGVILESGQQVRSKVVVTADGVHAHITEKAGFPVSRSNPWYIAALTYEFDNIWSDLPLGYHYLAGGMEPEEEMAPGYSSAQGALGVTDTIHVAMGFLTSQKEYPANKPLDYYVQRVIDTDPRVHKVMGDRLFGRKPDMITGCRVMFRERHLEDTVGNGVIAVGDAWVDDCDLGNIPSLANGVHAGRVISLAAKAGDFSKKALDAANEFKSEPVLKYSGPEQKGQTVRDGVERKRDGGVLQVLQTSPLSPVGIWRQETKGQSADQVYDRQRLSFSQGHQIPQTQKLRVGIAFFERC